jgi:hypothetical protein
MLQVLEQLRDKAQAKYKRYAESLDCANRQRGLHAAWTRAYNDFVRLAAELGLDNDAMLSFYHNRANKGKE